MEFIWTNDFEMIPYCFVEQIKDRNFTPEEFYAYNKAINSQLRWLLIIKDKTRVVGFCWGVFQLLDKTIFINNISLDKEYQNKGLLKQCLNEIEKTAKNIGANKVAFISKRGKRVFEEKLNFKTCGIYFCKELKEE